MSDETVEVETGWDYEGDSWWAPVTSKRTPKYARRVVPRALFERYEMVAAEYHALCEQMRAAEQRIPRTKGPR